MYILSWFGNSDVSDYRRKVHAIQVQWAFDKGFEVIVQPQQYKPDDYIDGVIYLDEPKELLAPGPGRNLLFKHFYESDEDMAIFADNDGLLSDYGIGETFFEDMNKNFDRYRNVDFFIPANPAITHAYGEIKHNEEYKKFHIFSRKMVDVKGTFFVLRNLKKYYDIEIYNDPFFDYDENGLIIGEDTEFCINVIKHGFGVYLLKNVILKEFGGYKKSCWTSNYANRRLSEQKAMEYTAKKYNIPLKKNGKFNTMRFMNEHFQRPKKLMINIGDTDHEFFE